MTEAKGDEPAVDKGSDRMESAMQEAMEAVEAREAEARGEIEINDDDDGESEDGELELEVGGDAGDDDDSDAAPNKDAPPKKDAATAVTESLLKAKHELEEVVDQTRKEVDRLKNKWLRAAADLENFKKRARRDRDRDKKFANEGLLKDMLPVFDDMELTLQALNSAGDEATVEGLIEGVQLVHKKFLQQLAKNGVTTFESSGSGFDPMQHEAVSQVHSEDVAAGGVASQVRRGFFLNERLLRPALVTVSLGTATPTEGAEAKGDEAEGDAADEGATDDNADESAAADDGKAEDSSADDSSEDQGDKDS